MAFPGHEIRARNRDAARDGRVGDDCDTGVRVARDVLRAMRARDRSVGAVTRKRGVGNARRDLASDRRRATWTRVWRSVG